MKPQNDKAIVAILNAGKEEFLEKGFEKASLRTIASKAGVTTGSIYSYFNNKSDLFNALVEEPAQQLYNQMLKSYETYRKLPKMQQITEMESVSIGCFEIMLEYIYAHYDAFRLIADCSVGTDYENYIDKLMCIEERATLDFIALLHEQGKKIKLISNMCIHILVGTLFHGIFEFISHELPYEVAKEQMTILQDFYVDGWFGLFGMKRKQ